VRSCSTSKSPGRFARLVIASGDHAFAVLARRAAPAGISVVNVTGYGKLSAALAQQCSTSPHLLRKGRAPTRTPPPREQAVDRLGRRRDHLESLAGSTTSVLETSAAHDPGRRGRCLRVTRPFPGRARGPAQAPAQAA